MILTNVIDNLSRDKERLVAERSEVIRKFTISYIYVQPVESSVCILISRDVCIAEMSR